MAKVGLDILKKKSVHVEISDAKNKDNYSTCSRDVEAVFIKGKKDFISKFPYRLCATRFSQTGKIMQT